jgi:hypothetical protein
VASVTLRFYGRFVYAEAMKDGKPANKISAIAPNFDVRRFGKHQALMTIQRDQLEFGPTGALTTLAPAFRNVSDRPEITDAEFMVWDLSGLRVTYPLSGDVALKEETGPAAAGSTADHLVLDLERLEKLRGGAAPTLAPSALRPDARGRSNAVIEITAGIGVAKPVLENAIELGRQAEILAAQENAEVELKGGTAPGPTDFQRVKNPTTSKVETAVPADHVEFTITLPGADKTLKLTFMNASGEPVGVVTVKEDTTVSFSNLCCDLRPVTVADLEFSQYYTLLSAAPDPNVLIPVEVTAAAPGMLGEGQDCDIQARLSYSIG